MMGLNKNKISVVISVLNARKVIENCIISVLSQNYKNIELIIIDGGSIDGTIEIIKNYSDKILYWISERDTGIYNAWNKAVVKASGEWLCFIGSDDILLPNSLTNLLHKSKPPQVNFVSSRVMMVDDKGKEFGSIGKPWNFDKLSKGLGVVHCGALHHITLFEDYGLFDEGYNIAGDFEFLVRVGKNIKSEFLNEITVNMCNTGVSRKNIKTVIYETSKVLYFNSSFGKLSGIRYFFSAHARNIFREFIFVFPFGKKLFSMKNKI